MESNVPTTDCNAAPRDITGIKGGNHQVRHSEHRLYAGIEGSACMHGPVDVVTFFAEAFNDGPKFSFICNQKLTGIRRNLAKVKPKVVEGKLSETPMYAPLVKACNSIAEEYLGKALHISFHDWPIDDTRSRMITIPYVGFRTYALVADAIAFGSMWSLETSTTSTSLVEILTSCFIRRGAQG